MVGSSAHLKNLGDDEEVRKHWSHSHNILPEYQKASNTIAVEDVWMVNTMLLRQIRDASTLFGADLERLKDGAAFDRVFLAAIRKGYK